jgi:lipoate-protein ligase B
LHQQETAGIEEYGLSTPQDPGAPARPLWVANLGRQAYPQAWSIQRSLLVARKRERIPDLLVLTEHDPVFTLGRNADRSNLRIPEQRLLEEGIPCLATERGGDITYHGPGQLVGYPILKIPGQGRKVKAYVASIEQVLLRTLEHFGISGRGNPGLIGVWAGDAKIASIGVAVEEGICYHGFALNVDMDLAPFSWIHPCGLRNLRVTSMACLLRRPFSLAEVAEPLVGFFCAQMRYDAPVRLTPGTLMAQVA